MNPRVFLRGAAWGVRQCVGTVWGSMGAVGTSGAPDHGVHWSSMGPGGLWMGGRGVKCEEPTRVLRGVRVGSVLAS